jgi:hypothetical protein
MIQIRRLSGDEYEVRISSAVPTTHRITLHEIDRQRLGGSQIPAARLIEESFRFLLEREPNTSILSTFDLPVIGRYFPEYDAEIARRLGQR